MAEGKVGRPGNKILCHTLDGKRYLFGSLAEASFVLGKSNMALRHYINNGKPFTAIHEEMTIDWLFEKENEEE